MPVLLGIASGAARVAGKLFQGVKRRKEKRAAKREERAQAQAAKFQRIGETFTGLGGGSPFPGTSPISQSGNELFAMRESKGEPIQTDDSVTFASDRKGGMMGGFNPMWLVWGLLAYLGLKALKVIR